MNAKYHNQQVVGITKTVNQLIYNHNNNNNNRKSNTEVNYLDNIMCPCLKLFSHSDR